MIYDISVPLSNDTPVYPGDPKLQISKVATVTDDGYMDHSVTFGTHNGTHIDAPAHMIDGGKTLGRISVETFVGRGKLVDGFSLESVKAAGLQADDIVLFHTGMSDRFNEEAYWHDYHVMSVEAADLLVEAGIKMVGVDAGSVDIAEDFPIHKRLLGAGILIIENLTGLDVLAGKEFVVYALPLKFDLDGSPARVIAITKP
jgi:arylformamidase